MNLFFSSLFNALQVWAGRRRSRFVGWIVAGLAVATFLLIAIGKIKTYYGI